MAFVVFANAGCSAGRTVLCPGILRFSPIVTSFTDIGKGLDLFFCPVNVKGCGVFRFALFFAGWFFFNDRGYGCVRGFNMFSVDFANAFCNTGRTIFRPFIFGFCFYNFCVSKFFKIRVFDKFFFRIKNSHHFIKNRFIGVDCQRSRSKFKASAGDGDRRSFKTISGCVYKDISAGNFYFLAGIKTVFIICCHMNFAAGNKDASFFGIKAVIFRINSYLSAAYLDITHNIKSVVTGADNGGSFFHAEFAFNVRAVVFGMNIKISAVDYKFSVFDIQTVIHNRVCGGADFNMTFFNGNGSVVNFNSVVAFGNAEPSFAFKGKVSDD